MCGCVRGRERTFIRACVCVSVQSISLEDGDVIRRSLARAATSATGGEGGEGVAGNNNNSNGEEEEGEEDGGGVVDNDWRLEELVLAPDINPWIEMFSAPVIAFGMRAGIPLVWWMDLLLLLAALALHPFAARRCVEH